MPTKAYSDILVHLHEENRLRSIPSAGTPARTDLLSNDYLGLATRSAEFMPEFLRRFPDASFTSSASRLLSRRNKYHNRLEKCLGEAYGRSVLLFNSGYHANVGMIQALAIPGTLFLADKLAHASAIDGLRLSGADFKRFAHNDVRKLTRLLKENHNLYDRIIVIVESVYSMDGDIAPLGQMVKLKRQFPKMLLYVDEAHSFGVRGARGLGLAEELDLIRDIDFLMATLGKAAASAGAFVATSPEMKDYLLNCTRSFIFSTALSPAQTAWSLLMTEKIAKMQPERLHLMSLSTNFVNKLYERANIETPSQSQIVPIIIGDPGEALNMSAHLAERGFDALAIRRPTVAAGSERIRISLNALLTEPQTDALVSAIADYR